MATGPGPPAHRAHFAANVDTGPQTAPPVHERLAISGIKLPQEQPSALVRPVRRIERLTSARAALLTTHQPGDDRSTGLTGWRQQIHAARAGASGHATALRPIPLNAPRMADNASMTVPDVKLLEEIDAEVIQGRRRHRKRLARIAADQWLWFARHRLAHLRAVRHRRRRLTVAALLVLRQATAAAASQWRQALVADKRRMFLLLGHCLLGWRQAGKRQVVVGHLLTARTRTRAEQQQRAVLQAWGAQVVAAAVERRRELQAHYFHAFTRLTACLAAWHQWTQRKLAVHAAMYRALRLWAAQRWRMAWMSWRRHVASRVSKHASLSIAESFYHQHLPARAFHLWRCAVADVVLARTQAVVVLAAMAARHREGAMREALAHWQQYVDSRRQSRRNQEYATAYLTGWRLLASFTAWRGRCAVGQRQRVAGALLAKVGRCWWLQVVMAVWLRAVEHVQQHRMMTCRAEVLTVAAFRTWMVYVRHQRAQVLLLGEGRRRVTAVQRRAVLGSWHFWAAASASRQRRVEMAGAWRCQRIMQRAVAEWRQYAQGSLLRSQQLTAAQAHSRQRQLSTTLRCLERYSAWRSLKRHVLAWRRQWLCGSVLVAWLARTRANSDREVQRRQAVQHRYMLLLFCGLAAFRVCVDHAVTKRQAWQQATERYERSLLSAALQCWSKQVLPAARAQLQRLLHAAALWRSHVLTRSLAGWQTQAVRLAIKHGVHRQAVALAERSLLTRSLRTWWHALQECGVRRVARAVRLTELQAALRRGQLQRLFVAWAEQYRDQVMQRFLTMRAHASFQRRLSVCAWLAWTSHVRACRDEHRAAVLAARHMWRRRSSAALQAWRLYTRLRRQKKDVIHRATTSYGHHLKLQAIHGFSWYRRHRQEKAAHMSDARAAYTLRLQREGAVQWLKVSLWRRQQRLGQLAMQQAKLMTEEIARVEPFARRWRQLAQQRSAQRLRSYPALPAGMAASRFTQRPIVTASQPPPPPASPLAVAYSPGIKPSSSIATSAHHRPASEPLLVVSQMGAVRSRPAPRRAAYVGDEKVLLV